MEIDMTASNTVAAVEVFLAAKAQFEEAEAVLKAAKADIVTIIGGYGFIEGETADVDVALQSRKSINEKALLALGLTQAQIDGCKIEGEAFRVFRVKAKKVRKAA